MYCRKCGADNEEESTYCFQCGAELSRSQASSSHQSSRSGLGIGVGARPVRDDLVLHCSMCEGQDFARDTGRLDSRWGFTSFKVVMLTCKRCGHIEFFNKGRSIFDFD